MRQLRKLKTMSENNAVDASTDAEMRRRLLAVIAGENDKVFSKTRAAREFEQDARPGKWPLPARLPNGDVLLEIEVGSGTHDDFIKKERRLTQTECECGCEEAEYFWEAGRYGGWVETEDCVNCGEAHIDKYRAP